MAKHALITGATGMIGSLVLQHCLDSAEIAAVTSLTRRPGGNTHGKLREIIVEDFLCLDGNADYLRGVDIVYYCLGVYSGAVGRSAFRTITVDYPDSLADILVRTSPNLRFCLLSGGGADPTEKSPIAFARDKGAIENRLSNKGFRAFHTFRPGYIYPVTPRAEPNLSYSVLRWLYPLIRLFGQGSSITSTELAEAMFRAGLKGARQEILENRDILRSLQG